MKIVESQDRAGTVAGLIACLQRMHEAGAYYVTDGKGSDLTVTMFRTQLTDGSEVFDVEVR